MLIMYENSYQRAVIEIARCVRVRKIGGKGCLYVEFNNDRGFYIDSIGTGEADHIVRDAFYKGRLDVTKYTVINVIPSILTEVEE